ncbi:MAG: DUF222 domain-containing protein [Nocardioidaceae bacterium]
MFDTATDVGPGTAPGAVRTQIGARAVTEWLDALARLDREVEDGERIDQIRALEALKAAASAAQARATADLDASRRAERALAGVRAADQGAGVAGEVALARRESPVRGSQHLGLAKVLTGEMPHTLAALTEGRLSEWRVTLLVRETACLTLEDRRTVDRVLAADPARLEGLGDHRLVAEAKKLAYQLDPVSALRRSRKAEGDRRVTCRPAPDTMANLTALLPVGQAVAAYAALTREANGAIAGGDPRTRGQIMADTLVQRVTGQAHAADVPVEVQLVMTDFSLLGGDDEPAHLEGHGPVPAGWARDLISQAVGAQPAAAWVRRLYTRPDRGDLVEMESRRRCIPPGLIRFVRARDRSCRTPWCDAPIRHGDHVVAHQDGGPTSAENSQGLCEQCNHVKQAAGWQARPSPGRRHTVATRTPTGHRYRSTAPRLPGAGPPRSRSRLEFTFADLALTA